LVRQLWAAGERLSEQTQAQSIVALQSLADRAVMLSAVDRGILKHALTLCVSPHSHRARDVEALRALGLSDLEIHDVTHVVCCFSYMNRLADGLGVAIQADRRALAIEMLGEAALSAHEAWARGG